MAVEVDRRRYMFRPTVRPNSTIASEDSDSDAEWEEEVALREARITDENSFTWPASPLERDYVFQYNPIHDLESLWWVAMYFLINKQSKHSPSKESSPQAQGNTELTPVQRDYARSLFYGGLARLDAIHGGERLEKHMATLPSYLSPICAVLLELRRHLVDRYNQVEVDPSSIDKKACGKLYQEFSRCFTTVVGYLKKNGDVTVRPIAFNIEAEGADKGSSRKRSAQRDMSANVKKQRIATS